MKSALVAVWIILPPAGAWLPDEKKFVKYMIEYRLASRSGGEAAPRTEFKNN
jgi:hypothetical protein